ncbi:protein spotted leaf 11 [Canna indica]|uniref:RING-type E3 ubiquitin transferase n=1 Tax=Canna indica TaxID=4628 RepID=A0AAQ3KTR8_9LILI|nr:protein spotted leaf 11 [Canna indica]
MEEREKGSGQPVERRLARTVEEIAAISEFRNAYRKPLCSLSRRIRLLGPMFDELADAREPIAEPAARALTALETALAAARDLLRLGGEGSKIFLVLERDMMVKRFQDVTIKLDQALDGVPFEELEISEEVREQVELVHAQFKRAKERDDMPDAELYANLLLLYNKSNDTNLDPFTLARLAENLQLVTISDLKQESLALHEMVFASGGGDPGENIEKMSMLLKKIKDFVLTQNPEMGTQSNSMPFLVDGRPKIPTVPDDFRCPISLELMKDPVIVATGQTYERTCIEKWLASGHDTCPKTQQRLSSMSLTPNYVLRSLIEQWCEANGVDPPKCPTRPNKPTLACSSSEHAYVDSLLGKLSSGNLDDQRSAAGELRLLAKRNVDNRICIAKAGAIPLLINLLSSTDSRTQEHGVTALLNLSIHEDNKASIMVAGAVPGIVHVLRNGSMEARENAAATLFSLSVVDEYKVTIGASGAIPVLVSLLSEGTHRGKKDAATALFNLCIYQGNKGKAVRAGVVPLVMGLVMEPAEAMMDEALAILSLLSSHSEGKSAIAGAQAVPLLVGMIKGGSPRNRENAAAILLNLCGEQQLNTLAAAQECGIMGPLQELAINGTDRGKRKAVQLLERMNRFLVQQQEAHAQAEASIRTLDGLHARHDKQRPTPTHTQNGEIHHQNEETLMSEPHADHHET